MRRSLLPWRLLLTLFLGVGWGSRGADDEDSLPDHPPKAHGSFRGSISSSSSSSSGINSPHATTHIGDYWEQWEIKPVGDNGAADGTSRTSSSGDDLSIPSNYGHDSFFGPSSPRSKQQMQKASRDPHFPFCAWQFTTSPDVYLPLLLDPHAVYQPLLISFVTNPRRIYRVQSAYQQIFYFSYQTYTLQGQPMGSLIDRHIQPKAGKNPYVDMDATPHNTGTYEIYITRDGARGLPNELKGGTDLGPGLREDLSVIMLRLYNKKGISLWGGVDPPVVSYSDDNGDNWKELPLCASEDSVKFNKWMKWSGRVSAGHVGNLLHGHQKFQLRSCPLLEHAPSRDTAVSHFYPYTISREASILKKGYMPYTNYDSSYLYWCDDINRIGQDFVVTVQGHIPKTPDGLYEGVRIADTSKYDVRYISFESADLITPSPTYAAVTGLEMQEYYGTGWDGDFMLVSAVSPDIAKACAPPGQWPPHLFLPFANPVVNPGQPPDFPAIIYRQQLPNDLLYKDSPQNSDHRSIYSFLQRCDDDKKNMNRLDSNCNNPSYMRSTMGHFYPEIKVYSCDRKTGQLTLRSQEDTKTPST